MAQTEVCLLNLLSKYKKLDRAIDEDEQVWRLVASKNRKAIPSQHFCGQHRFHE
jgi:hypothetical protein